MKHTGRFEPYGEGDKDPLRDLLLKASWEMQIGAVVGFFTGVLVGAICVTIAVTSGARHWWLLAVASLVVGLIGGAIGGKVVDVVRSLRRRARRKKREEKERQRLEGRRPVKDID